MSTPYHRYSSGVGLRSSGANHGRSPHVSPKNGDKINSDRVTIRYVLAREVSVEEIPIFNLLLDDEDPVQTNDSEYTFGVMPGGHTVIVQVVDANGTPIMGAQDQVQFTVSPPKNGSSPLTYRLPMRRPRAGQPPTS